MPNFPQLQKTVLSLLPADAQYDETFDKFEYLFSLVWFDIEISAGNNHWAPMGRYFWHNREYGTHVSEVLRSEAERYKADWKPIQAGLFNSVEEFVAVEKTFREAIFLKTPRYFAV